MDIDSDHVVPEPEVEPNESHRSAVGVLVIADSAMAWPVLPRTAVRVSA